MPQSYTILPDLHEPAEGDSPAPPLTVSLAWTRDSERKTFAETHRMCLTRAAIDRVPRVDAGLRTQDFRGNPPNVSHPCRH
jgi:hypothetical protein